MRLAGVDVVLRILFQTRAKSVSQHPARLLRWLRAMLTISDDYCVTPQFSMSRTSDWDQLIAGLRDGDHVACAEFCNQYGVMLERVAAKQLSHRLVRRIGPEDVVQSAYRTFFRRVAEGQFDLPDNDSLWNLMCAITLQKARRVARDQGRQKRSFNQEQYFDPRQSNPNLGEDRLEGKSTTPLDEAMVADQLFSLLDSLGDEECQVLDLKLQQFTNDEIADRLACSERTVRRLTKKIQSKWNQMFDESDAG